MRIVILMVALIMTTEIHSQEQDASPFYEIPSAPDSYTAGNVIGRLVDGLGFRYYWATEGLREQDLGYKPSTEGRSLRETLDHIYGLTLTIVNAPQSIPNLPSDQSTLSFEEIRTQTLSNLQKASDLLKAGKEHQMEEYRVIFGQGERQSEYPFWNMINGPIADALWHTGQVVLLRRASGNPINPSVSFFNGRLRE